MRHIIRPLVYCFEILQQAAFVACLLPKQYLFHNNKNNFIFIALDIGVILCITESKLSLS